MTTKDAMALALILKDAYTFALTAGYVIPAGVLLRYVEREFMAYCSRHHRGKFDPDAFERATGLHGKE